MGITALVGTVLHAIEAATWATAYRLLGEPLPGGRARFNARATLFELVSSPAPVSNGSARTESRNSKRPVIRRTEKRIPAIAAERGVFKRARIKVASCFIRH